MLNIDALTLSASVPMHLYAMKLIIYQIASNEMGYPIPIKTSQLLFDILHFVID